MVSLRRVRHNTGMCNSAVSTNVEHLAGDSEAAVLPTGPTSNSGTRRSFEADIVTARDCRARCGLEDRMRCHRADTSLSEYLLPASGASLPRRGAESSPNSTSVRLSFSGAFESKASPDLYDFVPRGWGRGFRPTGGPTPGACVQRDGAWHGAARSRRYGRNHAR